MSEYFKLDSGHVIELCGLHMVRSAEGVLIGSPSTIRRMCLKHLPGKIERYFWKTTATLILENGKVVEPEAGPVTEWMTDFREDGTRIGAYTFIAFLMCNERVPGGRDGYCSRLLVAWFQDDLEGDLVNLVSRAVRGIDWNKYAENWED